MLPDRVSSVGVATPAATPPTNSREGDLWYNTTNQRMFVMSGGAWLPVAGTGAVGANEVFVGTTAPVGTETVWIDTSNVANPVMKMLVNGGWQAVFIQPTAADQIIRATGGLTWQLTTTIFAGNF